MKNKLLILILLFTLNSNAQDFCAFEMDSLWGYKDKDSIVIKPQFQYAYDFYFGKGVVFKNGKAALINAKNEIIVPYGYNFINLLNDSLIRITEKTNYRGKYNVGVITDDGKEVLPMIFNSIFLRNDRLFVEKRRDSLILKGEHAGMMARITTHGIFSLDGVPVLEPIYDGFEWLDDSLIRIRKGQYYALAKSNGQFLTDLKYIMVSNFYNGKSTAGYRPSIRVLFLLYLKYASLRAGQ